MKKRVTSTVRGDKNRVDDNASVKLNAPEERTVNPVVKETEVPISDPFHFDAEQCDRGDEQVKTDIPVEELISNNENIEADMTDMAEETFKKRKNN